MSNVINKRSLLDNLCCASAAGLLLGSAGVYAAGSSQNEQTSNNQMQNNPPTTSTQFSAADTNRDQGLVWTEIYAVYEPELEEAGWDQATVLNEFDENRDDQLNVEEYAVFVASLEAEPTDRQAGSGTQSPAGSQQQNQNTQGRQDLSQSNMQDQGQNQASTSTAQQPSDAAAGNAQAATTPPASQDTNNEQSVSSATGGDMAPPSDLTVEDIKDLPVRNVNGQELGEVKDVVLRQDGVEAGLVVTLSAGSENEAKDIFVSLDQLAATEGYVLWLTPLNEEEVQNLPEYNDELYVSVQ